MNDFAVSEFFRFHPLVNFAYYTAVIIFSMIFMNPVFIAISVTAAVAYIFVCSGKSAAIKRLFAAIPFMILTAAINAAFNHEGATVLTYLPSGNPLTAESIFYGLAASAMLIGVIYHFTGFNKTITSDKLMYLFGKISPSLALVLTLTLRFVPRFTHQIKNVATARSAVFKSRKNGMIHKAKEGISVLSIMITWSMENAVDTADSMKSRGCGLDGRTAFSLFAFEKRDVFALFAVIFMSVIIIVGASGGAVHFRYFPTVAAHKITPTSVLVIAAYAALCFMPVIIEIKEALVWRKLKSKI